jgi:hypothetical protein
MALALLVLAWVERYPALLAFGLGFLVIMLVQSNQVIRSSSPWHFLPQLIIPAVVLLLGSAAFYHVRPTIPQDA